MQVKGNFPRNKLGKEDFEMKKFFAMLMALVMALSLIACGGSGRAWNTQMGYDPISKMMKNQTVQTTCWACGGMRGSPCGNCGGDGKW